MSERRFFVLASALFLLTTCLLFNRAVFAGEWLSARDTVRVYLPLAKFWVESLRGGEFPQWYPYDSLGQPFVGMMVSAAFHPSKLFYLALPLERAITVSTLLCYPIAAFGTYVCARLLGASGTGGLFAGLTFAFSGYMVGISNNHSYLIAGATFPWVLAAAEYALRQTTLPRVVIAAAALASIAFAGETQTFALSAGAVLLLGVLRPGTQRWPARLLIPAAIVVTSLLFAAVQLIPALNVLQDSRQGVNPIGIAEKFSLHPLRLLELVFGPLFIDEAVGTITSVLGALVDQKMNSTWSDAISVGAPGVVFAFASLGLARRNRFALSLALVAVLIVALSLGSHLPLYSLFYRFVPLWSVFRYPEKLVPFFTFILALSAGVALTRAFQDVRHKQWLCIALAAMAVICFALCTAQEVWGLWSSIVEKLGVKPATSAPLGRWFVRLSFAMGICTALIATVLGFARAELAKPLLIGVQAILLVWLHLPLPQTIDVPLLTEPIGFVDELRGRGLGTLGAPRLHAGAGVYNLPRTPALSERELHTMGGFATAEPDIPALFGFETTNLYLPAASARVVQGVIRGSLWLNKLAALYGAAYFIAPVENRATIEAKGRYVVVSENKEWGLLLLSAVNPPPQPRAYLAYPRCIPDATAFYEVLRNGPFQPGVEALVECGKADAPVVRPGPPGIAHILSYRAHAVTVATQSAEPSILVLNDAWYAGWEARVDGALVAIEPVNLVARGVRVPIGDHEVAFTYREPGLRSGALISATSLITLIALAALSFYRRRAADRMRQPG